MKTIAHASLSLASVYFWKIALKTVVLALSAAPRRLARLNFQRYVGMRIPVHMQLSILQ